MYGQMGWDELWSRIDGYRVVRCDVGRSLSGRHEEAEQFYKYATRFNLQNESLLKEFSELQDQLRVSHLDSCFGTSSEAGV